MTTLQTLTPDEVASVYDGIANRCACGCSGRYFGPDYFDATPDTNDLMVKRILARVQRRGRKAAAGEVEPLWHYTYEDGSEAWAYQTKTRLVRVESKPRPTRSHLRAMRESKGR